MHDPAESDARVAAELATAGFAVLPGYADEALWRGLGNEARRLAARGAFRAAGVGRGASWRVAPELRSDRVAWIEPARATRRQAAWLARMEALRRQLNQTLTLGLFGFETHLACYPPGSHYVRHLDRFADARHRVVSVLLYLNAAWQPEHGGALRLYPREGASAAHDVLPEGGTFVAFLSGELPHEVLPTARERWSLVGWFTARSS